MGLVADDGDYMGDDGNYYHDDGGGVTVVGTRPTESSDPAPTSSGGGGGSGGGGKQASPNPVLEQYKRDINTFLNWAYQNGICIPIPGSYYNPLRPWESQYATQGYLIGGAIVGSVFTAGSLWYAFGPAVAGSGVTAATIQFGNNPNQVYHTFRHVVDAGLEVAATQSAILSDVMKVGTNIVAGQPFNQTIIVNGQNITYTAYKLADGIINIGRITIGR